MKILSYRQRDARGARTTNATQAIRRQARFELWKMDSREMIDTRWNNEKLSSVREQLRIDGIFGMPAF